jgi:hypothetical protein
MQLNRASVLRLLLAVTLTACQSSLTAAPPDSAQSLIHGAVAAHRTGHLWISVETSTHYPSIERFRLINGVPETTPDLVYDGYGGNIAVAGDGTLYSDARDYASAVFAFSPNSNQPSREITIPARHACDRGSGGSAEISALAANAAGYLFVGIYTTPTLSRSARHRDRNRAKFPRLCEDVAVYAPTANGKAVPLQLIHYPKPHWLMGLAADEEDNVFVDDSTYEVDEFSNAITDPKRTRVFSGAYVGYAHSIATDANGNLYIGSTGVSYKNGRIERYAPDAGGSGPPTSTIVLPSGVHLLESIAERGRVLYVDDVDKGIDLYHARKNGSQTPFYSFTAATYIFSVATGP